MGNRRRAGAFRASPGGPLPCRSGRDRHGYDLPITARCSDVTNGGEPMNWQTSRATSSSTPAEAGPTR